MSLYLDLSKKTLNLLLETLLTLIENDIRLNTIKLGGENIIVQINECCVAKRKYHVRRIVP